VERSAEEPGKPCWVAKANAQRECITVRGPEGDVVAKKRGNARGAKGPY